MTPGGVEQLGANPLVEFPIRMYKRASGLGVGLPSFRQWSVGLQTEHEKFLSEEVFNKPVIVTTVKRYKAFRKANSDDKTVAAMDVLVPRIGEIIGGAQREDSLETLKARMSGHKIPEEMAWYLDLRSMAAVRTRDLAWGLIDWSIRHWNGKYSRCHPISKVSTKRRILGS